MKIDSLSDYSKYAAQEYLQSVVFIDDRIYQLDTGSVTDVSKVKTPQKRKPAVTSMSVSVSGEQETADVSESENESTPFSPHDIVASFAKKQILCSLFQPKKTASMSERSDIHNLCSAADIVIVDWDFDGDYGEKAKELVTGLIHRAVSDTPEQLRLILVYTQEPNLFDISNQLFIEVDESLGEQIVPSKGDNGLSFHTPNSRVCVLGKTGRQRVAAYETHEVPESELAERAIFEFSKLASGLMHAPILLGLANIKKNSRKIISKFSSDLDPAFLTHRAMYLPKEDVSRHLIPLLMHEIESVLEDSLPAPLISDSVVTSWCDQSWQPGDHLAAVDFGLKENQRALGAKFSLSGKGIKNSHPDVRIVSQSIKKGEWARDKKAIRKLSQLLLPTSSDHVNHKFAHLMSSRTYYGNGQRGLTLGTIVLLDSSSGVEYLLCLQPVCDSVRLSTMTGFIFSHLEQSDNEKSSHVVFNDLGDPIQLCYRPKVANCRVIPFSPSKTTGTVVTKNKNGVTYFSNTNSKNKYVWVDQLKTSHAQRAVESYARELSRVGLTESEWLRMMS